MAALLGAFEAQLALGDGGDRRQGLDERHLREAGRAAHAGLLRRVRRTDREMYLPASSSRLGREVWLLTPEYDERRPARDRVAAWRCYDQVTQLLRSRRRSVSAWTPGPTAAWPRRVMKMGLGNRIGVRLGGDRRLEAACLTCRYGALRAGNGARVIRKAGLLRRLPGRDHGAARNLPRGGESRLDRRAAGRAMKVGSRTCIPATSVTPRASMPEHLLSRRAPGRSPAVQAPRSPAC